MQRYQKGDYVQVTLDDGKYCWAVTLGSYRDFHGRGSVLTYRVRGVHSNVEFWADESRMLLLDTCRMDLVQPTNYGVIAGLNAYRRMQYDYSDLGCA